MDELIVWKTEVSGCTDSQLVAQLQQLTCADRKGVARLIVYLGEVDARGLYREHAHSSMYGYLVDELQMSEPKAYLRLNAARLGRKYPMVIEMLATGAVHLTAPGLVSRFLTPDNHAELLARVRGKTKREVLLLVAELDPQPDMPARMRRERKARPSSTASSSVGRLFTSATAALGEASASESSRVLGSGSASSVAGRALRQAAADGASNGDMPLMAAPVSVAASAFALETPRERRGSCTPLGPGRYRLQLTADQALHDTIEQLKHLLRHQVPDGDLAVIVRRALELLLRKTLKERFAQTVSRKPRSEQPLNDPRTVSSASEPSSTVSAQAGDSNSSSPLERNSRYIPREVLRDVYAREAGQCAFVAANGRRCAERGALEVHHVVPFARGGRATVENLKLVCRSHNQLCAERDFGRAFMRQRGSGADVSTPTSVSL